MEWVSRQLAVWVRSDKAVDTEEDSKEQIVTMECENAKIKI